MTNDELIEELEALAERWERRVNTPNVANMCAEELHEIVNDYAETDRPTIEIGDEIETPYGILRISDIEVNMFNTVDGNPTAYLNAIQVDHND